MQSAVSSYYTADDLYLLNDPSIDGDIRIEILFVLFY